jgi:hypothetical protein
VPILTPWRTRASVFRMAADSCSSVLARVFRSVCERRLPSAPSTFLTFSKTATTSFGARFTRALIRPCVPEPRLSQRLSSVPINTPLLVSSRLARKSRHDQGC